jgi:hypothetical protein
LSPIDWTSLDGRGETLAGIRVLAEGFVLNFRLLQLSWV